MNVLNDNLVLRKLDAEEAQLERSSGLVLTQTAEDMRYAVVASGPGRRGLFDGKLVPNVVAPGDIVLLADEPRMLHMPGENLFVVTESDVIAVVGSIEVDE